jgi:DNA recombination protein RmuC
MDYGALGIGLILGLLIAGILVFLFSQKTLSSVRADHDKVRQGLENERNDAKALIARLEERVTQVDRLENEVISRDSALNDMREEIANFREERRALEVSLQEREIALGTERDQMVQLKKEFQAQFAELSAVALKENSEAFLNSAKKVLALQHQEADADLTKRQEQIQQLVKPIHEGIKAVSDAAKEMELKREKAFGTIEEQLKQSIEHSAEVARQASGLKDALKKPNVRGRWGEVQLKNCIELAGMEEHCDVVFQDSTTNEDGKMSRPDMIVRMPGGRKIAVDAKTPMEYFIQFVEANTDEERTAALIGHGRGVRTHVSNLAKTDYMQNVAGSPDFVVMFLPNESFLAMALEKEPSLMEEALSKKVLITTPGTLVGLLKVIRYGWNEQKIAINAQNIADAGAKLNTEISRFLDDFAKVGLALQAATEAFDNSKRRVEKQIANTSANLTALGAKSKKELDKKSAKFLNLGEAEGEGSEREEIAGGAVVEHGEDLAALPFGDGDGAED